MMSTGDVYGKALSDYYAKKAPAPLILYTNNNFSDPEEMPIDLFFRDPLDFPEQEQIALALCNGKVLDIGAGVGSHSLYLQSKGIDVTALELSTAACEIMQDRGVKKVLNRDIYAFQGERFDTLLFLMNGIGLAQTLDGLKNLLEQLKTLLNPGGQVLFDSSDISYYYAGGVKKPDHYFGEVRFQYEYKKQKSQPFGWLYIDQKTLTKLGKQAGFVVQVIDEDDHYQYLARLELNP